MRSYGWDRAQTMEYQVRPGCPSLAPLQTHPHNGPAARSRNCKRLHTVQAGALGGRVRRRQERGCVSSLSLSVFKPRICSGVGWTHCEPPKPSLGTQRDHREPPPQTPNGYYLFCVLHFLSSERVNAILCETQLLVPASASPGAFGQLGKGPDCP